MRLLFKWFRRLLAAGVALLVVLALAGAGYHWIATRNFEHQHPPPGELIDVGGHRLHLHHRGTGGPAVIIDAGLSLASYHFEGIADEISKFTQVCTYDRAGYGWSDPGPLPRTSQRVVSELRTLLQRAEIKPPYLLVGQSWGGLNVRLYASKHPDEVAGLVLVDALNKDLIPPTEIHGKVPKLFDLLYVTAPLGTARLYFNLMPGDPIGSTNASYRAVEQMNAALNGRTKSARVIYHELTGQANWLEVQSELKHLGDMPVTVISRRIDAAEATNSAGKYQRLWLEGQKALSGISRQGKLITASTKSHNIHTHEPDIIINAVREMVESLRSSRQASEGNPVR